MMRTEIILTRKILLPWQTAGAAGATAPSSRRRSPNDNGGAAGTLRRTPRTGTAFPSVFFDTGYYLTTYPDVAASGQDPLTHFLEQGRAEGRRPSAGWAMVERAVQLRAQLSPTPVRDIVTLFPRPKRSGLAKALFWKRLRAMIHPRLYAAQIKGRPVLSIDETFDHFLSQGAFEGLRVSALFHEQWYRRQLEQRGMAPPGRGIHPFFHWLTAGWKHAVVPTPLYDEDFYVAAHPDMERLPAGSWRFLHYAVRGCYEPGRRPSTVIARPQVANPNAREQGDPLFLPQLLHPAAAEETPDLRVSSPLEDTAVMVASRVERLRSPQVRALVEKAAAIEPLILRPYGPREVNLLPVKHPMITVKNQGEALRRALPATHFDTIVLAPHCRMAGSARVTGALTKALGALQPDASVLLLTTDLPDFDRPDWFSDHITVFDFSTYAAALTPDEKLRLLLDAVRGLTAERVINVNSRLGWDLFKVHGKQLSTMTELGAYLFTWDLDSRGNKGGYPITYFQDCFAWLSWVVVDNSTLRDELIERYAMSSTLQRKLFAAYTPVPETTIDHSSVFERRRADGRILRTFWAGRFDRQKRFDLVVELAEALPELEIWVWGKTILGGLDVDFDALPPNIKQQGTFRHFDDLPIESCDFFLYTSEWDGLPTVLLDAGARAIPTVASFVGGVGEVLDDETGFPVRGALDASSYVATIREMLAQPQEVTRRAQAFQTHVRRLCSQEAYLDVLKGALSAADPRELTHPNVTDELDSDAPAGPEGTL